MVDVVNKKCNCGEAKPTYGLEGERPSCCKACKTIEMIDVVNKKCVCGRAQPTFGLAGGQPSCCLRCKNATMIDIRHNKCVCGKARPTFGLPGERASCCSGCKLGEMVDVVNRFQQCTRCNLPHDPRSVQNGVCYTCRLAIPRPERVMRVYLAERFPDASWVFDKTSAGISACSDKKYRPDAWLQLPTHVLVVECDEDQHKRYEDSCELRRLVELWAACEGKPLTVIRWNPDEFKVDGQVQDVSEYRRLTALRKVIEQIMTNRAPGGLRVEYMFYDCDRQQALQKRLQDSLVCYE